MKTGKVIFALGLLSAAASCWFGCQQDRNAARPSPSAVSPSPQGTNTAWEYKTVEKEMSDADLRKHMQEWSEQGWAVLSISAPIRKADGTIHRKVELRRPKP